MIRENKYRGQRLDNREWVTGNLINVGITSWINDEIEYPDNANFFKCCKRVDPATIGQYWIGKGENEIYTGDILAVYSDCYSDIEDAKRDGASICISAISPMGEVEIPECDFDYTHIAWLDDHCMNYEKVGNIHDNPELLKGGVQ